MWQCCGSGMLSWIPILSIPDPRSSVKKIPDPGSGSTSKNLSFINAKKCFLALGNTYDPGCPGIFLPIPDSGVKNSKRHRIRIRNTGTVCYHFIKLQFMVQYNQLCRMCNRVAKTLLSTKELQKTLSSNVNSSGHDQKNWLCAAFPPLNRSEVLEKCWTIAHYESCALPLNPNLQKFWEIQG